jgi:hypothetical protein
VSKSALGVISKVASKKALLSSGCKAALVHMMKDREKGKAGDLKTWILGALRGPLPVTVAT